MLRYRSYRMTAVMLKAVSLLTAVVILITAVPSAIALETFRSADQLVRQTITLTPEEGVTVTLEGLMPAGGYATAKNADMDGKDVLHAYDITIFFPGGGEFEPDEGAPISVSFQSRAIAEAIEEDNTALEVEHITDSGEAETVELISAEDGEAVFEADSFSVYVIRTHTDKNENLKPRKTFHFLSPEYISIEDGQYYESAPYEFPNKLNEMVTTQTVTDGESLQEIVLPDNRDSGLFYGWYEVILDSYDETLDLYKYHWGSDDPTHIVFNEPIAVKESTDTDVYLAPLFGHYRFLTFHQDKEGSDNANTIITRKLITLGEDRKCTLKISDVRAPSTNPNRIVFWGWKYTHSDTDSYIQDGSKTEEIQTVNADDSEIERTITIEDTSVIEGIEPAVENMIFDIWPVFKEARWVYFESGGNGASYVPAQFIMIDEPPTGFSNVPTRSGYEFQGWYYYTTDENGSTVQIQVTDANANVLHVTKQLTDGVSIQDGKLVMTPGASEQTFHAQWLPASSAKYHVIVWKQKISDDKDTSEEDKTYDFDGYYEISGDTTQEATKTTAYLQQGFENFASTKDDYNGFQFARATVTDNGYGKVGKKVNPNGSTVVNVYYDRKLVTLTFKAYPFTYTSSTANSASYAYYNGEYITVDAYMEILRPSYPTITKRTSYNTLWYLSESNSSTTPYTGKVYNSSRTEVSPNQLTYNTTYYRTNSTSSTYRLYWKQYSFTRYTRTQSSSLQTVYTYQDLYEKNIGQIFNMESGPLKDYAGYGWSDSNSTSTSQYLSLENMPAQDSVFTIGTNFGSTSDIYYYLEVLPGEEYDREYDGRYYTLHKTVKMGSGDLTYEEEYHPIEGYDRDPSWSVPAFSNGRVTAVSENYLYYHLKNTLQFVYNNNYDGNTISVATTYGQPLAEMETKYTPPAREHYIFTGWYEDESCTKIFNFNSTMPAANKMVYAGWKAVRYRVTVEPDGGEFPLGGTYSTYFKIDYGELISPYDNVKRTYLEDSSGEYLYVNVSNDIVSKLTDSSGAPLDLDAAYRKTFYVKKSEIRAAYDKKFTAYDDDGNPVTKSYALSGMTFEQFQQCIDMNTLYSKIEDEAMEYRLVSWHKVKADGTLELTPFNFQHQVDEDTRIRARWMRVGKYSLVYNPTMKNTGITGSLAQYNDPLEGNQKFSDQAPIIILQEPTLIKLPSGEAAKEYVFRGWRIVDGKTGEPLEDDVFYDPGDTMILNSKMADSQGVIHMEAYYEKKESTVRRVDVTSLTLDANAGAEGAVSSAGLKNDSYEYADINARQIRLERQSNNFDVDLKNYIKNFSHTSGHRLLGWNTSPGAGDYIPEYYADAFIGVNKNNMPNTLYAVWEPMVYLNLQNKTTSPVEFELDFAYDGLVYEGNTNTVTGEYERHAFSDDTDVVTKLGTGSFKVTLPVGADIQLVLPEGEGATYTVTGSYADDTNHKTLIVYNTGDTQSTTIDYYSTWRSSYWRKNGTQQSTTPVPYSTTGTLKVGAQGQTVLFEDEDPQTKIFLKSCYYDVTEGAWKYGTTSTGAKADARFSLPSGTSATSTGDGYTSTVNLINNNKTTTFGLTVNSYDSTNYKFIGWYTTDEVMPNTFTVDGHANDFGAATISGLAVPPEETTYYAVFVPYASGDLIVSHSERSDSAGHSADNNGLSLNVKYSTTNETKYGDRNSAAEYTISSSYIYEKNTSGSVTFTVGAVPHEGSSFEGTYRGNVKMTPDSSNTSVYTASVPDLLTDSDTVKGLKVIEPLSFYSVFSRGYTITYIYTARDGQQKNYVLTGNADSFDDFSMFVIEHTPDERTLAGDIIWDIENMKLDIDDYGMNAVLTETAKSRAQCTVTIVQQEGTYRPSERINYGNTFSEELAQKYIAPTYNAAGQQFDYWDIINTDTGEHIANCYSEKFTFAVWNNYTITPHYSDVPTTKADEGTFITIDYIDTSRNQWGDAVLKNDELDRSALTDKVIADVDISFIDGDRKILDTVDENGSCLYQLGMLFEICGTTADGTFNEADYAEDEATFRARAESRVNAVIAKQKASSTGSDANGGYYYTRINISEDTVSDFNRSQLTRSFTSGSVKNRVLRMYAYMVTPDGSIVLSAPKYLSMYNYVNTDQVIQ